ncbi:MAG: ABC transporter substrate-binding protein [Fibrobacter sp.]|nr:ABC transporter substrate-binding protein [Fibrobacter sp.]
MNIKQIVKTTVATALAVGSLAFAAKQDASVVKIAYFTGALCEAPFQVAWLNGYFKEEFDKIGQKFEMVRVGENTTLNELIVTGKADAGFDLLATRLQPIENGLPITFVTGLHTGCTKFYVKKGSKIKSAKDSRGKKIGVVGLTDSSVMQYRRKLRDAGIISDGANAEVEFVVYTANDLPIALDKGAVDIIGLHDPIAATAEEQYGFTKILDTTTDEKLGLEYCCQAFVTLKLLKNNPQAAAAIRRAAQRGAAYVAAEPRKVAQLQIDHEIVAGKVDFNTKLLESYNFIPSAALGLDTFKKVARELQATGILKKKTNIDKFIKDHYVNFDELGIKLPDGFVYDPKTGTFTEVWEAPDPSVLRRKM